ncbi:MAG: NAD(P)H-hydrate dehydratase [Gemmatimonadaceae bacterium]
MPPSVRVVSARESAERDRAAIESGIPSRVLMQRAGKAAADEISRRYANRLRNGVVIFTGPGNNGGDGWVVAGVIARSGIEVTVIEAVESKTPDAIAEKKTAIDSTSEIRVLPLHSRDGSDPAAVVIDALLGTGAEGEPRGMIAEAIAMVNALRAQGSAVAALDIPSGLNATTGFHSTCVVADTTFTFGGVKRGTLVARDCCGEIVALDIGLDDASNPGLPWLVDGAWVKSNIPSIHYDAHKGTRKHLAIVGAGKGMPGSVVLATRAALRSGIGLVRSIVAPENVGDVLAATPSALISEWPTNAAEIKSLISDWVDAVVIGPGLGHSDKTRRLVEKILRDSSFPVLLDADALNVFKGDLKALAELLDGRRALITPHVAEFSRLTGVTVQRALDNRFDIGSDIAARLGATVLLKGSPTVIFSPDGTRYVVPRGTAALGTGGSGDLLDGIAGTLLAQMYDPTIVACCASWVHGRAAEMCEYVRGTTLDDVLYALPRAWNEGDSPVIPPVLAELPAVAS